MHSYVVAFGGVGTLRKRETGVHCNTLQHTATAVCCAPTHCNVDGRGSLGGRVTTKRARQREGDRESETKRERKSLAERRRKRERKEK